MYANKQIKWSVLGEVVNEYSKCTLKVKAIMTALHKIAHVLVVLCLVGLGFFRGFLVCSPPQKVALQCFK